MTSEEFKTWRKSLGFNQAEAADSLGLSRNAIIQYEKGCRLDDPNKIVEISKTVALACAAISAGLKPLGTDIE